MAEAHSTRELPPDIIFCNILPRLPAKSLLRFKSVSKQWHSSLTTPSFEKLHLHHSTNDHPKLLAWSTKTPSVFHTIDCEAPEDGLTAGQPLPFDAIPENLIVLASSGGLVCVGINGFYSNGYRVYSDLILWNPLTGDYKTLSNINSYINRISYNERHGSVALALYYSSCDDDYKLLSVTCTCNTYIYSLKSDSWRKINSCDHDLKDRRRISESEQWRLSTAVNEKIYILKEFSKEFYSIIMFDTKTEKFTELSTPLLENRRIYCVEFTILRGCIHLYVVYYDYTSDFMVFDAEFWRIDGDANWKKVVTDYPIPSVKPIHLMRDGNWLTRSLYGNFVFKMGLHIKPIEVSIDEDMCIPLTGKYIETLVSPNR